MKIYEDKNREKLVNQFILENKEYYIDFEDATPQEISDEIKRAELTNFVNWQKGNRFSTLNILNYIGNVFFFGNTYDVRSQKFLTDLSGAEQFKAILDDIQKLSKNIIYTNYSPSRAMRKVDFKDLDPSILLIFNYFKSIILYWDSSENLQSSINRIVGNANFKYTNFYQETRPSKLKKIDNKTFNHLALKGENLIEIKEKNHLLNNPITKFISKNASKSYFPFKMLMKKKSLSFDTPENQFVKFFLQYIEANTYKLNYIENLPQRIKKEQEQVLSFCRSSLSSPFFKNVGQMIMLPTNSTVLSGRAGYKEILQHFIKSRFGVSHIFENFKRNSMSVELKKISDLYEYWVLYKIVVSFFGADILASETNQVLSNGDISYGMSFKKGNAEILYNHTESRSKNSAYGVSVRPDITIVIKREGQINKIIFDAKYKVQKNFNETDAVTIDSVKSEDLIKMHAYVDAIEHAKFAMAVYTGNNFVFYEKEDVKKSVNTEFDTIGSFQGVGAIPLVPQTDLLDKKFDKFIEAVKNNMGYEETLSK